MLCCQNGRRALRNVKCPVYCFSVFSPITGFQHGSFEFSICEVRVFAGSKLNQMFQCTGATFRIDGLDRI
nr:MAG TPA: hypothetical protein [Caudoviricetes sp.]